MLTGPEAPLIADKPTSAGPDRSIPKEQLQAARKVGAIEGTLTIFLLALVNPVGGLMLAFHSFIIKYVSQVMLEGLATLTSLLTVLAYVLFEKRDNAPGWLLVSSICLGLTAASKYIYCLVGLAILTDWFLLARAQNDLRRYFLKAGVWGGLALVIFLAADPYLWPDLAGRLQETIFYHAKYATTANEVQGANFPVWQPFAPCNGTPPTLELHNEGVARYVK